VPGVAPWNLKTLWFFSFQSFKLKKKISQFSPAVASNNRKKGTKLKKEVKEVKEEKDEKEEELNETLELETEIVERKNKKGPGGAKGKGSNLFSRPR